MATGFEIVGVVFAVIPLVIEGAKQYGNGVETIQNIRHYQSRFDYIVLRLSSILCALAQAWELLLVDLVQSNDQLQALLKGDESQWASQTLVRSLEKRFTEPECTAFINSHGLIFSQLRELAGDLGLDQDCRPTFMVHGSVDEQKRRKFFKKRVKYRGGFNFDNHNLILTRLDGDVRTLKENIQTAKSMEVSRQARRQNKRSSISWIPVRNHSKRIFDSLVPNFLARSCPFHQHMAHLKVKTPTRQALDPAMHEIDCFFTLTQAQGQFKHIPWKYRPVCLIPQEPLARRGVPMVRIQVPGEDTTKQEQCKSCKRIDDLCSFIETGQPNDPCRGFLGSQEWEYHIHGNHPSTSIIEPELKSLRGHLLDPDTARSLTIRDRRTIALALASTVLQLHGTAWLSRSWTLDEIVLHGNSGFYVTANLSRPNESIQETSILRNETMFSLGEALLELVYKNPPPTNAAVDVRYKTAIEMLRKLEKDELKNYVSVVRNCLSPSSYNQIDYDLENSSFLQWYYESIVTPLKEDYEELGKSVIDEKMMDWAAQPPLSASSRQTGVLSEDIVRTKEPSTAQLVSTAHRGSQQTPQEVQVSATSRRSERLKRKFRNII